MEPLVEGTTELFGVVTDGLNAISDDMVVFAKNIEIALKPVFKWIIDSLKNMFEWFDAVFATQRNLATIQVKTGDQFKEVRNQLLLNAKGITDKDGNLRNFGLPASNNRAEQRAKEMAGVYTMEDMPKNFPRLGLLGKQKPWEHLVNDAVNEIFQENVATYVEKELGLKAIKPKIEEVTVSLEGNITKLKGLKKGSDDLNGSLDKTFGDHMKTKLGKFSKSIKTVEEGMADVVVKGIDSMADALTDFVLTGKLAFKDFARSIIADMARIAIRSMIIKPIMAGFGLGFAKGGVFENGNQITAYSKGGVVDRPTMFAMGGSGKFGIMGEGGSPEAIMPLKRGKGGRLGVEATGGGTTNNIVVNVDSSGTETSGDQEGKMLGQVIAAAVKNTIVQEQRPGGLLAA